MCFARHEMIIFLDNNFVGINGSDVEAFRWVETIIKLAPVSVCEAKVGTICLLVFLSFSVPP